MDEQHSLLEMLDDNALADVSHHLEVLILSGQKFTAEDLRARMSPYALAALKEHSGTFGAALRRAHKAKRIEKVGYQPSTHDGANSRVQCIWVGVR